ncbi:hypothetical protein AB0F77_20935 [Streptomyces sp. NPDC026672]|uniref:hypothetical protein n=1 Tax=unclassified Streptomyces TaxID=2593676 RepID=UPI0033D9F1C0
MSQPTDTQPTPDSPRAYGSCSWCGNFRSGVRLIHAIEQGSGPGWNHFACVDCRVTYGLTPLTDRP